MCETDAGRSLDPTTEGIGPSPQPSDCMGFFIDSPQWHKESMSKRRYVGCNSGGNDFSVSTPDQDHPTKQPHPFWDKEVKRYRAQFR